MRKPDTHFVVKDDPEYGELTAMRVLWRACIAQALRDLVCADVEAALDAAQWIGTPDFQEVCDHAAVDADWLESKLREALAKPMPYRKASILRLSQDMNIGLTSGVDRGVEI